MSLLYLQHFGLAAPPFAITPNPALFFAGGGRGEMLDALEYSARHQEGIVAVTGEVGSGKTMLCRMLLERQPPGVELVYLANPSLGRRAILASILADLRPIAGETSGMPGNLLDRLHARLIAHHSAGRRVLLVVDEAHAMPPGSLEEIRLLSNLETGFHKLLQIVLFGQPELESLLLRPAMRPLRDRIVERLVVPPLSLADTRDYLRCRLHGAGLVDGMPFSRQAVADLWKAAGGLVRRVNVLADKSMLAAFARGRRSVDRRDVRRALSSVFTEPTAAPVRPIQVVHA